MNWVAWLWAFGAIYILGFAAVLWFNLNLGPITFGLALFRAVVWPLYVFTGIPVGQSLPMD